MIMDYNSDAYSVKITSKGSIKVNFEGLVGWGCLCFFLMATQSSVLVTKPPLWFPRILE